MRKHISQRKKHKIFLKKHLTNVNEWYKIKVHNNKYERRTLFMFNKDKHNYEVNDYHTLCLELTCSTNDKNQILRISNVEHYLSNFLVGILNERYERLKDTRKYHRLRNAYQKIITKQKDLKDTDPNFDAKFEALETDRKQVVTKLNKLIKQYGLTYSDVQKLADSYIAKYDIHTVFVTTTVENVYSGLETVLYGDGKTLNFKSRKYDFPSIRAKEINRGISLKYNKKTDELNIRIGQSEKSKRDPIILNLKPIKRNDYFAQDEIALLKEYLYDKKGNDEKYKAIFDKTGIKQNTHRPCYVTIVIKPIRHNIKIYAHITIVGSPCRKLDHYGNLRHQKGSGTVACDLGPQSTNIVAHNFVKAMNLAERNGKSTKDTASVDKKLQQKMAHSLRYSNPDNYNENGTIKKGAKKWIHSKNYEKLAYKLHEKRRRDSEFRHYATQEMVNDLREHGDVLVTEENRVEAWKRRSKKQTEQTNKEIEVTNKKGEKKKVKKCKKKRRGMAYSILHRIPGFFMAECEKKFKEVIHVDKMFRASQYDHTDGSYKKKKLSERWFVLSDGTLVPRDLYSAFLMYCADLGYKNPSQNLCNLRFDKFMKLFTDFNNWVKTNHIKIANYN